MAQRNDSQDRKATIVAADDDPMIRQLLGSVLARAGYEVKLAASGREAIALAHEVLPDLVVLDYVMPDLDGAQAAEHLKKSAVTREIPVLLVSAMEEFPATAGAAPAHAWDYRVQKPFTPAQLKAKIAEILDATRPRVVEPPAADVADGADEAADAVTTGIVRPMRQGYVDALKETVSEMEAELAVAPGTEASAAVLESLRRKFHKIRGSAATFGFPLIGEVAAEAEALVTSWQGGVEKRSADSLNGLRSAVDRIADLLKTAARGRAAAPSTATKGDGQGAALSSSVLLLHNDPAFAEAVSVAATRRGYDIETFDSPVKTLERLREKRFSMVTIAGPAALQPDCEWVRAIRELGTDAAIVLVGGEGSTEHRVTAAQAGVDRYLAGSTDVGRMLDEWRDLADGDSARSGRVLVVDDDTSILEFVETQLRRAGCEVACLDDAVDIFSQLEQCDPDLLLLDVDMPSANGLEVARAVRSSARWGNLPIVIQTSHTSPEYRLRAFENGADDFINKPIVEEELHARVVARLDREKIKRDLAGTDPVTGFYGREPFCARAAELCGAHPVSTIATVELERLADITRRHGLEAGEAALVAVAEELRGAFRSARDVLGRVGASVVAVAVPGAKIEEVTTRIGACLEKLEHDARLCVDGGAGGGAVLEAAVLSLGRNADVAVALDSALRLREPRGRVNVRVAGPDTSTLPPPVYVVEDDEHLGEMIAFALRAAGCSVQRFRSGTEALRELVQHAGDARGPKPVVLLDVDLPDVDGFHVLEELGIHRPADFHVVMLTANHMPGQRVRALRSGASDYMVKPVKIPSLLAKVDALLKRSGAFTAAPAARRAPHDSVAEPTDKRLPSS